LPCPDLVFCTGDIGFGDIKSQSLADQYQDAATFFDNLLKVSAGSGPQLPANRLFIVPGNHDVTRASVNKDAQAYMSLRAKDPRSYVSEINVRLANRTDEYIGAMKRLEQYAQFFSDICSHVRAEAHHLHYVHRLTVKELDIQIVGLNSAWNCSGDEEERRVWVGTQPQLSAVSRDRSLRLGLVHHPLEWMTKPDASLLEQRMGSDLHFLLHGHEHEYRCVEFNGGHSVVGTGAVSATTPDEHGVVLTHIDFDSKIQTHHVLVYSMGRGEWFVSSQYPPKKASLPSSIVSLLESKEDLRSNPGDRRAPSRYGDLFQRLGRLAEDDRYCTP